MKHSFSIHSLLVLHHHHLHKAFRRNFFLTCVVRGGGGRGSTGTIVLLLLGGTITGSRYSSHVGSSPAPEHLPSKIRSVQSLRCFIPYLQSMPLVSRSRTRVTCIWFHNSFSSCVPVFSPGYISSFFFLFVALVLTTTYNQKMDCV